MLSVATSSLIQGLLDCGGYEKGPAFIKDHAGQITLEFVSALRDMSMNMLGGEQAEPDLAPVFAELAVVAAIVLEDDDEKGMSLYCKGSILARLGRDPEAITQFQDAQYYFRTRMNTQQLANCLYDTALCHDRLGERSQAIRLLEEALSYQNTTKERAETLALMLRLMQQSGSATYIDDMLDLVLCASQTPHRCNRHLRETTDLKEKNRICEALLENHPILKTQALFKNSIPHFLESPHCRFFVIEDTERTPKEWAPYAYGIVKEYQDTYNDEDLLGLEAVCFADPDSRSHLEIIEDVRKMAQDLKFFALCISPRSLSNSVSFRALLRRIGLDALPWVPMKGAEPGVYSAFIDSPDTRVFCAHCISIRARAEKWDFEGELATGSAPFYRGEGRLERQVKREQWHCFDLPELSRYFFSHGFKARTEGKFAGTAQAQLLHQGYVNQPTVSLSESDKVCAYYATDNYSREEGGAVFKIDRRRLLEHKRVYDSLGTLKKQCPWVLGDFYDTIRRVMSALDDGRTDVRESGAFLARCHAESRRRVELFGGGQTFGPPIDWADFLGHKVFQKLETQGIAKLELDAINEEFEMFWNVAFGKCLAMDTIDADTSLSDSIALSRAYFCAFDQVLPKLREVWRLNRYSQCNNPGWDLSPFGYITKTIRDKEFFSDGDVPGDCIVEARILDKNGRQEDLISNQSATG
jgi:hypothetical protein